MDYGFRYRAGVHATPTSFVDPVAVEAWDAWFRWREGHALRDLTIDATWSRVTGAFASLTRGQPVQHEQQIGDAISSWRLLPDERILAHAGTRGFVWPTEGLNATINLARFVTLPFTQRASVQTGPLAATVLLALRLIDDVRQATGCVDAPLRLGLVGLADAIAMLGADYTADSGLIAAEDAARLFATASLLASNQLARERGEASNGHDLDLTLRRFDAQLSAGEKRLIRGHGLRFGPFTAAVPRPRLALLANNVADALQPLRGEKQIYDVQGPQGARQVAGSGFALTLWRHLGTSLAEQTYPYPTAAATTALHVARIEACVQPWLDIPISNIARKH
jgi:ribonucleoside-diphosphate reductase alpha chain